MFNHLSQSMTAPIKSQEDAVRERTPVVLHVIDSLDPSGGAEKQLVNNLTGFDHASISHEVAVLKWTEMSRLADVPRPVIVHKLLDQGEPLSLQRSFRRLRALVRERKPDLVHATLPGAALATRLVAATTRQRAVESLVNISHEHVRTVDNPRVTPSKLRFHTYVDRLTMRFLSGFHAVSEAVAESWSDVVGIDKEKIVVIPRGVDISDSSMSASQRVEARSSVLDEFGYPNDSFLVLSVGRVEPQKGHRYLIEAANEIRHDCPQLRVLIVGRSGNSTPAIERLIAELDIGRIVNLAGTRRDLPRLLGAADAFVFPSLFEGNGGNAMIEAMAARLPIVTTNAAPMTDLIPDQSVGILVDRFDTPGLAEAMMRLAENPYLSKDLGEAARRRALTFPTIEDVAAMHQSWYLDLLSRSRSIRSVADEPNEPPDP